MKVSEVYTQVTFTSTRAGKENQEGFSQMLVIVNFAEHLGGDIIAEQQQPKGKRLTIPGFKVK